MRLYLAGALLALLVITPVFGQVATTDNAFTVPNVVRFSGKLPAIGSDSTIGVTFALYREQSGGTPLWVETQNVNVEATGRFSVVLGANHKDGIPADLFTTGEPRWLGVQAEAQPEQERVLLVSVPYAFKAGDADTLGGKPLSAFVLAGATEQGLSTQAAIGQPITFSPEATTVTTDTGVVNTIPKYGTTSNLTNSNIVDVSGNIGIGTKTPESILDIGATSAQTVRFGTVPWALRIGSLQSGTQFIGIAVKKTSANNNYVASSKDISTVNHTVMEFGYDGSMRLKQQPHQADGTVLSLTTSFAVTPSATVGIGVDKPVQKLEVAGNVKINGTGNGIVFPDGTVLKTATTGTSGGIAGVSAGTGLTGGGTSGTPTLSLDTTYTDARYSRIGTSNTFTGDQTVSGVLNAQNVNAAGNVKITGTGNGLVFPDGTVQRSAAAGIIGVNAGTGLAGGGTSGTPTLSLDTSFTDTRYPRTGISNTFTADQTFSGVVAALSLNVSGNVRINGAGNGVVFPDGSVLKTASGTGSSGGITGVTAGTGLAGGGTSGTPVLSLDTSYTDLRYPRIAMPNTFTADEVFTGAVAVGGALSATSLSSGPQVVTGDVAASGMISGARIQAHVPSTIPAATAVSAVIDGNDGTGLDVTSTATDGSPTGIHATVNSAGAFGMIVDNIAGGNLLLGRIKVGDYWVKKFRVDGSGKAYANGGYLTGGADFAESFAVNGDKSQYEAGDVLVIDTTARRQLAKSDSAYSTLVAGVYSTKPGVLGSPYSMDDPNLDKEVPLAVVGVVPCKATTENGAIHVGDLLVTSSTAGYAMKGTDRSRMIGAVVGKALQNLDSGSGVIEILVSLQ